MKRWTVLLLGATLFLSGCSRWDWALRFADVYLMSEADRFFDLTTAQEKRLKPEVQAIIAEIRREDFPVFADFLDRINAAVADLPAEGIDRSRLDAWFTESKKHFARLARRFEPAALNLARDAGDEQAAHFETEFKRGTEKLRKKTDTPDKRFEHDFERAERWFKTWLHRPTKEQRLLLEAYVRDNPTPVAEQLAHRERLLADFLAQKGEARLAWIKKFYENPEALRDKAYAEKMATRENKLKDFLVAISKTLSAEQKKKLSENLSDKAAQLRRLATTK